MPARRTLRTAAVATALTALVLPTVAAAAPPGAAVPQRLTIAVVPDTQYLFDGQGRGDAAPLAASLDWLVEHAEERDVVFTASLGDLTEGGDADQMSRVGEVYERLEDAGMPYAVLAGNHDVDGGRTDAERPGTPYLDEFGPQRFADQPTFGGADETGYNTYNVVPAAGRDWLVLSLDWRMSDASFAWAQDVIDAHPESPVVLTTHELVADGGGGVATPSAYGQQLWDRLVAANDQVFLALGGHFWPVARTTARNDAGHDVEMHLVNYQERYYGGAGMIRLYTIDLTEDRVDVETFSPWAQQQAEEGNALARPLARPTTPGERAVDQFSYALDADERFAAFTPDPAGREPGAPVADSLVDGVVAYWRPGDTGRGRSSDGRPLAPTSPTLRDLSGSGNDLRLVTLPGGDRRSVLLSDDDDPDQPGSGSLRLVGGVRDGGAYLRTVEGAPIDDLTFADGYTVEAYVRLPEGCCEGDRAWSGLLGRGASGVSAGKSGGYDPRASTATLAFSPSRQVQWEMYPTNRDDAVTNWSHELEAGVWRHLAVVNDGTRTRMYVDGAPIARDPGLEAVGVAGAGSSWLVGATTFDEQVEKTFDGWVGDVRIADRALAPEEWLVRPAP